MQQQKKKILLYNWQALKLVLPYLKLSDLLASQIISKQWQFHLNQYIKKYIIPEPYSQLSSDAFQTAKLVFNRRLMFKQANIEKQVQFPDICSKIQIGNHATKLQTVDGNTYIIKSYQISNIKKKDWNSAQKVYKVSNKYSVSRVVGKFIYMINDAQILRYSTSNQNLFNDQLKIDFDQSIEDIITSVSAVLVLFSKQSKNQQYAFFTHNDPVPRKIQIPIFVQNPLTDIMLDFGTHGFIISSDGILYEADFEANQIKINQFKPLKGKVISKLKFGHRQYFAYEPKKKMIRKWANADVLQWAEKQGFQDYLKILQAQKVTGEKLLNMNKSYMEDYLGITNILIQQKMNLLIKQYNKNAENFNDYNVYGWGKNDKGQLCTNPSANVNNPIKLKLPQNMQLYSCSGDYTFILNNKSNQLSINSVDEQNKLKWQLVTKNKVWFILAYKNSIIYIQSFGKKYVPQAMCEEPIHSKKQKLRTAKNIMDQIQWDSKLQQQQFSVGYNNRFEGTLQCDFVSFLKTQVKQNNILYFKKNGKLVWDKKTRLDIL